MLIQPFAEQRRQGLKLWFSGVADRAKYRRVLIRIQPGLSLFFYWESSDRLLKSTMW